MRNAGGVTAILMKSRPCPVNQEPMHACCKQAAERFHHTDAEQAAVLEGK